MKSFTLTILLGLVTVTLFSQSFELGETKAQIEKDERKLGANLSSGMNEEGLTFLMDEGSDGMIAWYFDDNDICVARYMKFHSKEGRDFILALKKKAARDFTKMDNTTYCKKELNPNGSDREYCYIFSVPSAMELAVLIRPKE